VTGTVSFAFAKLYEYVRSLGWRRRVRATDAAFDRSFGVDTGGLIALSDLDVEHDSWVHGLMYAASPPELFADVMRDLQIRHEDFVFVDFGSGKGRVLLMASHFPFARIVGVEFSRRLHEIAQRNIAVYRPAARRCTAVESVCLDATAFPIPWQRAVFYLYRPFDEEILAAVLDNIHRSVQEYPRDVFVVYMNPLPETILDRQDWLSIVSRNTVKQYAIYGYSPGAVAG
jgi:SAM-dependent methyltransferase